MEVTLKIPKSFFADILDQLEKERFVGMARIGEIHLVGDHDNWGESMGRPGCIRPTPKTKMTLEGDIYVITVDLTEGMHQCKPVVITAKADANGFTAAAWIRCPAEGVGKFTPLGNNQNWQFVVKPADLPAD